MRVRSLMVLVLAAAVAAPAVGAGSLTAQSTVKRPTRQKPATPQKEESQAKPASSQRQETLLLEDGTAISVTTAEEVSSRTAKEGDSLTFKIAKAVAVNNRVVIAEGTDVKGTVLESKGAGRFGRGGKLRVKVESTRAIDGQLVPLRASQGAEGDSNMKSTVALTVLLGPVGLLRKGDDVVMKPGVEIKVFTDQDVKIAVP